MAKQILDETLSAKRRDIAGEITARILAELDRGVMAWRKPWDGARAELGLPRRYNGQIYRGVNVVMLWSAAAARGYRSPFWLTLRQANQLGGVIGKGERGELVVYYGRAEKARTDDNEACPHVFRFLKYYIAFNADQIRGLPEKFYGRLGPTTIASLAAHERWFSELDIKRVLTQKTACYIPSDDVIGMPPIEIFDSAEDYAATLNHESVHATMAAHRVGRDMAKRFCKHARAAEELVAEIGASILGAHLHLPPGHIYDHAAYIGHWMTLLSDDKRAFLAAAAHAQSAVDWLLAKSAPPFAADLTLSSLAGGDRNVSA